MDDFPSVPVKKYTQIRNEIASGDLLFCSGNSLFSNIIQKATHSVWSHVAFILRLDIIDRIMVLESVESIGVRTVPLSSYIQNYNATGKGYPGKIMLARHTELQATNIIKLSKFATNLLGYPYDTEEIVRIVARISMGSLESNHLQKNSTEKRGFICSEYAHECLKSIGISIDYNPEGFISPADFARCEKVKAMNFIETNSDV